MGEPKTGATCPKCQRPADVAEGRRDKNPWGPMRWSIHCRPCGLEVIGDFRGEVERKWAGFHEDVKNGREPTPRMA
jgi:hypothetical protein